MIDLLLFSGLPGLTNAGQGYENCLISQASSYPSDNINYYSALPTYHLTNNTALNAGQLIEICCTDSECSSYVSTCETGENTEVVVYCVKVGQTIVCTDGPGGCGGVVGNTTITNNTTLNPSLCPNNLTTVADYVATLAPSGLDQGYAGILCSAGSPCNELICAWDNGGWTCSGYSLSNCNFDSASDYVCPTPCILQWTAPWPGPNSTNPQLGFVYNSSSTTLYLSNQPNVPLIVGTTVGGTGLVGGGLTYYFWRKRKNQKLTNQLNTNLQPIPTLNIELEEAVPVNQTITLASSTTFSSTSSLFKVFEEERITSVVSSTNSNTNLLEASDDLPPAYSITDSSNSELARLVRIDRLLLNEQGSELLDNFLGTQEVLANANFRTLTVSQQAYQRARTELLTVLPEKEVSALEKAYQAENNQLVAQIQQVNY